MRKIFGPRTDEVTNGLKLHNEELHDVHCPCNIVRDIKPRTPICVGNHRYGEKAFGRSKRRSEHKIKIDLAEVL
jgi:hypothetical protein